MTQSEWKKLYARERASLGMVGMLEMLDRAPLVDPDARAIIFPHARLTGCGELVAAAAKAVVKMRVPTILALGPLHRGGRSLMQERGAKDESVENEEFCLDNFCRFVEIESIRRNQEVPKIVRRYPFLSGPYSIIDGHFGGWNEMVDLVNEGAFLVATTDPVHYGHAYESREVPGIGSDEVSIRKHVDLGIEMQLAFLTRRDDAFDSVAGRFRSDFRSVGPVFAKLLPGKLDFRIRRREIVDYSDVFKLPPPNVVAAALIEVH